jgi:hypothetical protein
MTILCMGGCREVIYPPPPQRAEVPHEVKAILDMTGGRPEEAWGSIVSGVAGGDPSMDWRWTMAHPTFRFVLDISATWKLNVRITAVASVLAKVGAQHVTFNVNGKAVGVATLDRPRLYDLTFPVDKAVFGIAQPAIARAQAAERGAKPFRNSSPAAARSESVVRELLVRFDVEPCVMPDPGGPYCILVHSVGFIQENR